METLDDYINWISNSMGISLTEEQIERIKTALIRSDKYKEMIFIEGGED